MPNCPPLLVTSIDYSSLQKLWREWYIEWEIRIIWVDSFWIRVYYQSVSIIKIIVGKRSYNMYNNIKHKLCLFHRWTSLKTARWWPQADVRKQNSKQHSTRCCRTANSWITALVLSAVMLKNGLNEWTILPFESWKGHPRIARNHSSNKTSFFFWYFFCRCTNGETLNYVQLFLF